MDEKELAKQMAKYADAITAFAFVQGTALGILIGQGGQININIHNQYPVALTVIIIATFAYCFMVVKCHRAEAVLTDASGTKVKKVLSMVLRARLLIVVLMGIAEVAIVLMLGLSHGLTTQPVVK